MKSSSGNRLYGGKRSDYLSDSRNKSFYSRNLFSISEYRVFDGAQAEKGVCGASIVRVFKTKRVRFRARGEKRKKIENRTRVKPHNIRL